MPFASSSLSSLVPPPFVPEGWPVVEPGLLMGYVGSVLVIRIGADLGPAGFARYIREWTRSVDARPAGASVFAMYDIAEWPGMTAVQRKEWGAMLKSREDVLRKTTLGMILASPSKITRGAARAIFWLAPPPYPYAVVDTPRAALEHIATTGGPPGEIAVPAYNALVKARWRGVEGGATVAHR
jgi:hypothetical protein